MRKSLESSLYCLVEDEGFSAKEIGKFIDELLEKFSELDEVQFEDLVDHLWNTWNPWMSTSSHFRVKIWKLRTMAIARKQKESVPDDHTINGLSGLSLPDDDKIYKECLEEMEKTTLGLSSAGDSSTTATN